ncbi:hypothetical protein ACWF94_21015 [Streptomyces sp. NPDC055078]
MNQHPNRVRSLAPTAVDAPASAVPVACSGPGWGWASWDPAAAMAALAVMLGRWA